MINERYITLSMDNLVVSNWLVTIYLFNGRIREYPQPSIMVETGQPMIIDLSLPAR